MKYPASIGGKIVFPAEPPHGGFSQVSRACRKWCIDAALIIFLCAGWGAVGFAQESFLARGAGFEVVFADPGKPAPPKINCRFLRPGWILALRNQDGKSIFRSRPLLRSHPASGCAEELVPAIPVSQAAKSGRVRKMKLGVGIIDEDCETAFYADPVQLFPWHTDVVRGKDKWTMTATQHSGEHDGYSYALQLRVTVWPGRPCISYEHQFKNTGHRTISFETYLHPFFESGADYAGAWFLIPGFRYGMPEKITPDLNLEWPVPPNPLEIQQVRAGRLGRYAVRMEGSQPFSKVKVWSGLGDCFAVEPFMFFEVKPGASVRWAWMVTVLGSAGGDAKKAE